jgi:DNA-binding MarR family transcriptional regulator
LNIRERQSINAVVRVIEEFRKLDADMQAQQMLTLLVIAKEEGIGVKEIAERTGVSTSAASRNVAYWSDWSALKREGHDLVSIKADLMDTRRKQVSLNPKGKKFVSHIYEHSCEAFAQRNTAADP